MTAMREDMSEHDGMGIAENGEAFLQKTDMQQALDRLQGELERLTALKTDESDVEFINKVAVLVGRHTANMEIRIAETQAPLEPQTEEGEIHEQAVESEVEDTPLEPLRDFLIRVGAEQNIPAGEQVTVHIGWIISDLFDGRTLPQDEFHNFYRWLRDECELSVRTEDNQFTFVVPVDFEAILQAERQAELAFENFLTSYAEENGFEEPTPVQLHINQIAKYISDRKAVKQILAEHPSVTKLSGSRFIITFPAKTIETNVVEEIEATERPVLKLVSDIVTIEEPAVDEPQEAPDEEAISDTNADSQAIADQEIDEEPWEFDGVFANKLMRYVAHIIINTGHFRLEVLRKQIPQLVGKENQKEYDDFKHHFKEFLDTMAAELEEAGYEAKWIQGGKGTRGTTYEVCASKPLPKLPYDPLKLAPGEILQIRREERRTADAAIKIEKLINDVQEWGQTNNHWKRVSVVGHFATHLSLSQKEAEAFLDNLIKQGIAAQRKEHGRAVIDWKRPTPKD